MTTTVTATYLTPSDGVCTGRVIFRLVAVSYHDGLAAIFPQIPVAAILDSEGAIEIELEPTSGASEEFDVTGMTYQVIERINGADRPAYYVDIPTAAEVDLGTLATYTEPPFFTREIVNPDLTDIGYATVDDLSERLRTTIYGTGAYKAGAAEVLQPFWAALANRNTAPVDIVYGPGSSLFAGTGVTDESARLIRRFHSMLRTRYPVNGIIGGKGYSCGDGQYGGPTEAGAPTQVNYGLGNRANQLATGDTLTWGSQTGTSVTVYGHALTAADAITVTIDNGTPATVTPGVTGPFTETFTLDRGTHLVVVGWSAGTPIVKGLQTCDGDETLGIRLWDNSKGGSRVANWLTAYGGSQRWLDEIDGTVVDPDLIIIDQLANDYPTISAAVYGTQLQALIDGIRGVTDCPVVLWMPHRRTTSGVNAWSWYTDEAYAVAAASDGVAVIDMDPLVDTATSGWLFDTYHPNGQGAEVLAGILLEAVTPSAVGAGTVNDDPPYTNYPHQQQVRGGLAVYGTNTTQVTQQIRPAPLQTVNVAEWVNAAGDSSYLLIDKNGRVISGTLTARGGDGDGDAAGTFTVDGNAGQLRDIQLSTVTGAGATPSPRWILRADGTAEAGANAGSDFSLLSRADNGAVLLTIFSVLRASGRVTWGDGVNHAFNTSTGSKIGTATDQKIGFWNATPVVQPSATAEAATDLATALTLVNDLRTKLVAIGLMR